jgi:uncharacterized protein
MDEKTINFGEITPEQFTFGKDIVLYNRFTGVKLFTTVNTINDIPHEEIYKLKLGEVNVELPSIKKFRVELTLQCNSDCDYCLVYKNEIPQIGNSMNMKTALKIAKKFNKEVENGSFMIIGGEPFMNREVLEFLVDYVQGNISVFTNGTLIDKRIAKLLSKPNITTLVSFDGWEELNFHRKGKDGHPVFQESIKGYKNLLEAGAKTGINCLVTDSNVDYMLEIIHHFHKNFGAQSFGLSIPHYTKINPFSVDIEKYTFNMMKIFDYAKKEGIYVDQIAKKLDAIVNEKFRHHACKIVGEQLTFYPDGTQTLCTKLDTVEKFKGKDLPYFDSKLPLYDKECQECSTLLTCGGGCFWDSHFDVSGKDQRDCYFNRKMLEKILFDIGGHVPKEIIIDNNSLKEVYKNMLRK